jgi:2'-5' RNA ligase
VVDIKRRLFFALWPDAATRTRLAELAQDVAQESGGVATVADRLHVTLAFLGEQPLALVPELERAASRVQGAAFCMRLEQIGCWRRSGIAWIAASQTPEALSTMRRLLAGEVAGWMGVDDKPFAPHVTLARRIDIPIRRTLAQPIEWRADAIVLVASELERTGPRYQRLASWALEGAN